MSSSYGLLGRCTIENCTGDGLGGSEMLTELQSVSAFGQIISSRNGTTVMLSYTVHAWLYLLV